MKPVLILWVCRPLREPRRASAKELDHDWSQALVTCSFYGLHLCTLKSIKFTDFFYTQLIPVFSCSGVGFNPLHTVSRACCRRLADPNSLFGLADAIL